MLGLLGLFVELVGNWCFGKLRYQCPMAEIDRNKNKVMFFGLIHGYLVSLVLAHIVSLCLGLVYLYK